MHGDGFLRANAGLATAVLGGPTFPITECNKGNKGNNYRFAQHRPRNHMPFWMHHRTKINLLAHLRRGRIWGIQ